MKKKYSCLATLSALLLISGNIQAADNQSAWEGLNAGISVGSHFAKKRTIDISGSPLITAAQPGQVVPYSLSVDRDESTIGGLLIGYNWKTGATVYGLEADYTFNDLTDKDRHCSPVGCSSVETTASASVDNLFTLRGRLGIMPTSQWLLALTGGLAAGKINLKNNINEFAGAGRQFYDSETKNKIGWAIGIEAGYAFTKNLMLRADYTYYDLGKSGSRRGYQTNPVLNTQYGDYGSIRMDGSLLRASLMYKF
jgi:outer membrane immunogenic protein